MTAIKFQHALLNVPVYVTPQAIVAWYFSERSKATHLICTGQTILPVSAKPEEVLDLLENVTPITSKGSTPKGE